MVFVVLLSRSCTFLESENQFEHLIGQEATFCIDFFQGVQLVWESYKLDPYVQKLAEAVFNFQEKVDDLLVAEEQIDVEVRALDTCAYA